MSVEWPACLEAPRVATALRQVGAVRVVGEIDGRSAPGPGVGVVAHGRSSIQSCRPTVHSALMGSAHRPGAHWMVVVPQCRTAPARNRSPRRACM